MSRIVETEGERRNGCTRRVLLGAAALGALAGDATLPVLGPRPALARSPLDPAAAPFPIAMLSPEPPSEAALAATRKAFERALSRPVSLRHYREGARLVDAAASGRGDVSVHTALTYAATALLCGCAVPVLRPTSRDGTAGMRAVVIARRDGTVRQLNDLAGRELLGATERNVAGQVVRRGLPNVRKAIRFDGADRGLARYMAGEGAALVGFERIDRDGSPTGGTMDRLDPGGHGVLWRSFPVWHGPVCVAASVDPALRRRIVGELVALRVGGRALTGLGLGGIGGFVAADAKDYAPLVALLRREASDDATTGSVRR